MIKNSKELKIAKENLQGFKLALEELRSKKDKMNPYEFMTNENASLDFIEDTEREIREYENLKSGESCFITMNSIHDLGKVLIQARIAHGLTQEELGKKLGLEQQQIHRYEAFDYESIKWSRMLDVIDALGIDIQCNKLIIKKPELKKPKDISDENIERFESNLYEHRFYGKAI